VLAVSTEAAATVTENLRQALDRTRTGAATAQPQKLDDAIAKFTKLLDDTWQKATGSAITAAERQQLLAVCSVVVVEKDKRPVEEALRDIVTTPGTETTLADLLEKWAGDSAATGTGGDAAAILLFLNGKISLKEPPSFRADIARLNAYSNATVTQLARFTTIVMPEGPIRLSRSVVSHIVTAALQGSLAVTGEPGAGKSAIMYAVAHELSKQYPVFCLTVETGVNTLASLQHEIGLEHPLLDVLQQVPGSRPAFLLLDALDASRGGMAEAPYKKLLAAVAAWPDWHVVASVRSFDLRLGQDWKSLFRGRAPFTEYSDSSFAAVRHLHVGPLNEAEQAELAVQSPNLAAALAAGGLKLQKLAQNPFNLALLADLLSGGILPAALAGVSTRGQLLDAYWEARVVPLGRPARTGLSFLVQHLLQIRSLVLPEGLIVDPAIAETIDQLEQVGVLAPETVREAIGFRHQVLFDYAVARLALLPDPAAAKSHLLKEKAAGLLLAPSLAYWIESLKATRSAKEFWEFIAPLVADNTLDPLVRVEVTRLAIETVLPTDDLTELGNFFRDGTALATSSLRQFVGALLTKTEAKQPLNIGPWAHLLAGLTTPSRDQLGSIQAITKELLDYHPDAAVLADLGHTARCLMANLAGDDFLIHSLSRFVIPCVARTYATDPAASQQLLKQIFEPDRFARFGYIELPALARHTRVLADQDPELIVQLYRRAFQPHDFQQDQTTTMVPSTIMAFHSNAAQDFRLAAHELAEIFPTLLAALPMVGIRVLATALRGEREKQESLLDTPLPTNLTVSTTSYSFEDDSSAAWAWDLEKGSDDYAEMYQAFCQWLPTVDDPALLAELPTLLLDESGTALIWRVLFDAGTIQPAQLGVVLVQSAANATVLQSLSTRRSAIALLALVYPNLPPSEREDLEQQWLSLDFATFQDPAAARSLVLGKLFNAISEIHLVTIGARDFLQESRDTGHSLKNDKLFDIQSGVVQRLGVDDAGESGEASLLPALVRAVQAAQLFARQGTAKAGASLAEALQNLDTASRQEDAIHDDSIVETLAKGYRILLTSQPDAAIAYPEAVQQLLDLTQHPSPAATATAEEDFARAPMWSPFARIEAAQALASLVAIPGLWPLVSTRFEELLLHDPRPEVRYHLAQGLLPLSRMEEEVAWQLAAKLMDGERNVAVIEQGVRALAHLRNQDASRLEPFIVELVKQLAAVGSQSQVLLSWLVYFALDKGLPASWELLQEWLTDYAAYKKQLRPLLPALREYFALGYGSATSGQAATGQRTRNLIWSVAAAVEPAVRAWPSAGHAPTAAQVWALELFSEIAGQMYFAVGYKQLPPDLTTLEEQRRFLADYAPLITRLAAFGPPAAVHYLLDVLDQFVPADPKLCFDLLSETILRTTGVARYEYEPQGATRFVELIQRYLADYRFVFAEETRQHKLIECLAVFVDVGWPEARRLFQDLPDLLQ